MQTEGLSRVFLMYRAQATLYVPPGWSYCHKIDETVLHGSGLRIKRSLFWTGYKFLVSFTDLGFEFKTENR